MLTAKQQQKCYQRPPSIVDYLPLVEFDEKHQCVLLNDRTVGAAFDLVPLPSETLNTQNLEKLRDGLQGVFQEAFPLYTEQDSPWIVQCYVEDIPSMTYLTKMLTQYGKTTVDNDPFRKNYLQLMTEHYQWLTKAGGVFIDDKVTGSQFQGGLRRVRLVMYRQYQAKMALARGRTALQDLEQVATRLTAKLQSMSIQTERLNAQAFHEWLLRWFNPKPKITNDNVEALLMLTGSAASREDNKVAEKPFGHDFTEQLFFSTPESNEADKTWCFDGLPHRYVSIQALSKVPDIGQLTRERAFGLYRYGLFDKFPEGSVFVMTVIMQAQDTVKNHLARIEETARKSQSTAAALTFQDCQIAKAAIEQGNYLFPTTMGIYLRGNDLADLEDKTTEVESILVGNGFDVLHADHELLPMHSYLNQLPFCYRYDFDKHYHYRSRYVFAKQLANLLPLYGRNRGTNHPLMQFLNRGGEGLTLDPLNPADKDNNSHLLILGSTGSGKSALSIDLQIKLMGTYKPYLVIVDAGKSFGLATEYFKSEGLSVHHVEVTLNNPPILNPFVDSEKMLAQIDRLAGDREQALAKLEAQLTEDFKDAKAVTPTQDDSESRDYMGEMALAAQLMITGGETKELDRLTRQDRMLILDALVHAARTAKAQGHDQMLPEDVVTSLQNMAEELQQIGKEPDKVSQLKRMADSLAFFCKDTIANLVFNRRGKPWPDADVTLFEQGLFKDEGYEAHNALAFMGLMSRTMAKAEAREFSDRATIVYGDEIHTLTKNTLTVVYLTKCAKMSRKFGLWLWLATQNVSDFPDEARKILSMMEFWICLGMSEAEMQAVEQFRKLTDEERELFRSVRKASKKYVEGVLLCPKLKTLFRNVPPRLSLALAMTEKDEKAERKRLMEEFGISELEAVNKIAERMLA